MTDDSAYEVIWAYQSENDALFPYHGTNRGHLVIDLREDDESSSEDDDEDEDDEDCSSDEEDDYDESGSFKHSVTLDTSNNYHLLWTPEEDEIIFQIQVFMINIHCHSLVKFTIYFY